MKERSIVAGVTFVLGATLLAAKSTDALFMALTLGFFVLCLLYTEGCSRL